MLSWWFGIHQGAEGTFSADTGASQDSARWGVGKPLYQDLIARTKAALQKNPKNVLLAVCWMQGEFDMSAATYAQQPDLFTAMLKQFRTDLSGFNAQCHGGSAAVVPWICGDTTYYWKNTYGTQYDSVYGAYKNRESDNVFFVPFMTDGNGNNTPTNLPAEDPDIADAGYYGAQSRSNGNWVSSNRPTHFSSWARRGIISDRLATAILNAVGRASAFISVPHRRLNPRPAATRHRGRLMVTHPFVQSPCCRQPERLLRRAGPSPAAVLRWKMVCLRLPSRAIKPGP